MFVVSWACSQVVISVGAPFAALPPQDHEHKSIPRRGRSTGNIGHDEIGIGGDRREVYRAKRLVRFAPEELRFLHEFANSDESAWSKPGPDRRRLRMSDRADEHHACSERADVGCPCISEDTDQASSHSVTPSRRLQFHHETGDAK
jgi:hypothetical protein